MSYGDEQQERWRLCKMAAKSGTYWIQMVGCAAMSSTVSLVALLKKVEHPEGPSGGR